MYESIKQCPWNIQEEISQTKKLRFKKFLKNEILNYREKWKLTKKYNMWPSRKQNTGYKIIIFLLISLDGEESYGLRIWRSWMIELIKPDVTDQVF